MIRKLTLATAFGAGYVLGAKAGRERYEQIASSVKDLASKPPVQRATDTATAKASDLADQAKDRAGALATDAVGTVKDKVGGGGADSDEIELGTTFDPATGTVTAPGKGSRT